MRFWFGLTLILAVTVGCRDKSTTPPVAPDASTRFDELQNDPPPRRASPKSVARAVARAQTELWTYAGRSLASATADDLVEVPFDTAALRGKPMGKVERDDGRVTLRLFGSKSSPGPVLATFESRHADESRCGTSSWVPEWTPAPGLGAGAHVQGEAEFVWWQFEEAEGLPMLLRFGPQGIALWRTGEGSDCYFGESFLALAAGGVALEDYVTPVALLGPDAPDDSGETDGTKPVRADILRVKGEESLTAREGVVELRTAKKKLVQQWKSALGSGSSPCSQAAFHYFNRDPAYLFFEVDFTDSEECDEDWGARDGQQTLFRVEDGELVKVLSASTSDVVDEDGTSHVKSLYDLVIPTGDGNLLFRGKGNTDQGDEGGEALTDCAAWVRDTGHETAQVSYTQDTHEGEWIFEVAGAQQAIGVVSARASTAQCTVR